MPPLPLEVTLFITLVTVGIFYLPHGVCVATDLRPSQNGFKCSVEIVIPLEPLGIGILAWRYIHLFGGHVYHLAQLFDFVPARCVSFTVLKGECL